MTLKIKTCLAILLLIICESLSLSLRILTYNIRHGENMHNIIDLEALSRVILTKTPDFVALQEVDYKTKRTGGVDQLAYLANSTGMYHFFSPHREFDGGLYGNGILSKWPIISNWSLPLPHIGKDVLPITAGIISANFSGNEIMFCSTHLDYRIDPTNRLLQVNKLLSTFNMTDEPVIVSGDFNSKPTLQEISNMKNEFIDITENLGNTYPSDKPNVKIDYVFIRSKFINLFKLIDSMVIPESVASDHRPVFVELTFN